MQVWDNPMVTMIAFAVVFMLIVISGFTIFGKMGKKTLKTYSKGRTKSEKSLYLFSTFGFLFVSLAIVFGLALIGVVSIPYTSITFDMSFIGENVAIVGIIVVVFVFIIMYSLIWAHQKGTKLPEVLKQELQKRD